MTGDTTKDTAVGKPFDVVALVTTKLRGYMGNNELILPANYSIENALKFAWLALQEAVDKDKRPVLQACSQASIANALLDMAVQGLNPGKDQCYFIAYGSKLICQRSYFGTMAVAQRVAGASDIWAEVVYEADEFEYTISHNRKNVSNHTQKLDNIKPGAIVAAYCVIEFNTDKPAFTEIMTMEQIKKAWAKSKMNPDAPNSTHSQFPEEMAKRTVTNRACKALINSSSDDNLFLEHFNRSDEEATAIEVEAEIEEKADKELLELESQQVIEEEAKGKMPREIELKRDPATLQTVAAMMKACMDDFGLSKAQVLAELGLESQTEITVSPGDCYAEIAAVRAGPVIVTEIPVIKEEGKPNF